LYCPWYLYSKFPSDFPLHKEFGHGTAGGVVPVTLVISRADAAKRKQKKDQYLP